MSRIYFVRHAQASFLQPDYDRLSPTGEIQARALGDFWVRRKQVFHRAASGPRTRQRRTAAIVAETFAAAQMRFPETVVMPEFDEYQFEEVLKQCLSQLLQTDARVSALQEAFTRSADAAEQRKTFQELLEVVMEKWVSGALSAPGVESWLDFCGRVNRGISRFLAQGAKGEQSVIFSSGGPIAVAVQRALNLQHGDTLRLSWMSRNCSYSEFLSSGDRFTLSSFNSFPHLDEPSLLTYR
jgi:broad specificity phosphatase PhoE